MFKSTIFSNSSAFLSKLLHSKDKQHDGDMDEYYYYYQQQQRRAVLNGGYSSRSQLPIQPPTPRVLIIQNDVLCPPLAAIECLINHGITYQVLYAFHQSAFINVHPSMYEAIIVLGGRAGVYEQNEKKWLKNEMNFIKQALLHKVAMLGICLGCQLIAECAGGKVYKGNKGIEIGYYDWVFCDDESWARRTRGISISDDSGDGNDNDMEEEGNLDPFVRALACDNMDKYIVLFHGDTFSLPKKCVLNREPITLLAKTRKYNTLFRIGSNCYGFQGHPEMNHDMLDVWRKSWDEEFLKKSNVDLKDVYKYSKKNNEMIAQIGKKIFNNWIEIALKRE